jgi:cytochrome c oxidase assembly protein Cox11
VFLINIYKKENQMSKKLLSLAMAMAFTVSMASVSMAGKVKCEVTAVDGHTVTLDCGKKAKKLHVGDKVDVKAKKAAAVEGC